MIKEIKEEIQANEYRSEDSSTVANIFFFNASGVINEKGYHVEFSFGEMEEAQDFAELLASYDMLPKLISRQGRTVVYLKSGECLCNLLALIGAKKNLMNLHEQIMLRSLRNASNRRTNCDTANLKKQVEAATAQVEFLKKLKGSEEFVLLSEKLRTTVITRIENPDASYEELSAMLGITKSGLVNRLSKLMAM